MTLNIDYRISRLLDQLEKEGLTDDEVAKTKAQIEYLRSLKE